MHVDRDCPSCDATVSVLIDKSKYVEFNSRRKGSKVILIAKYAR